jgi:hypothetical protein
MSSNVDVKTTKRTLLLGGGYRFAQSLVPGHIYTLVYWTWPHNFDQALHTENNRNMAQTGSKKDMR